MESGHIARFECENDKDKQFSNKGITKWQKCTFYLAKKGRVSEVMREGVQNEYNNNVFLVQMPQFCDKIYKSTKGMEKEKSANVSQTKS